ncbi:MAG: hypothetical protein ABIA76_05575 [Candidatus Diapherotrites archaeon]
MNLKKRILILIVLFLFFGGCIFFPDDMGEDDLAYMVVLEDNLSEECKALIENPCVAFECMIQACFCDETYFAGTVLKEKFTIIENEEQALQLMNDYAQEILDNQTSAGGLYGKLYLIEPKRAVKLNNAFYNVFALENGSESVFTVAVDGTIMKTTCQPVTVDPPVEGFEEQVMQRYYEYIEDENEYMEVRCFDEPELSERSFNFLKTKTKIFRLDIDCDQGECYGPCDLTNLLFYEDEEGNAVEFTSFAANYETLLEPMKSLDQVREYSYLRLPILTAGIDPEEDCNYLTEVPDVNEVYYETEEGFIYEGFEMTIVEIKELFYYKYLISRNGEITLIEREKIADCGEGIM